MYPRLSSACGVAVVLSVLTGATAHADKMSPLNPGFFIDGAVGFNVANVSDFTFSNPIGAANTTSAVDGDKIIMDDTDETDLALSVDAALGYRYDSNYLVRLSYSYLDQVEFEGFATFGGNPFQQLLEVDVHTFMIEGGYDHPISARMYVEGTVGVGLALVSADARQGLNRPGNYNIFPGQTRTNPAAKIGLGLGYHLTNNWGLKLTGEYLHLGRASSGRTGAAEVAASTGVNLSEELSGDISVWRAMAGIRYSF